MQGILFKPFLIPPIDEGGKTKTRRIIKNKYRDIIPYWLGYAYYPDKNYAILNGPDYPDGPEDEVKPKYKIGEVVYIKESYLVLEPEHCKSMSERFYYKSDHLQTSEEWRLECIEDGYPYKWKSPMFMPEKAARKFLKITDIKVELLNSISAEDCIAEGVFQYTENELPWPAGWKNCYKDYQNDDNAFTRPIESFMSLYLLIHGKGSWNKNPWVWVYTFEKTNRIVHSPLPFK